MKFTLRHFFHKAVTLPELEATFDQKLLLFEDSEKARLHKDYVPPKHHTKYKELRFVSKLLLLVFAFAFAWISGLATRDYAALGRKVLLWSNNAHDHVSCSKIVSTDKPISISAPPWAGSPVGAKILGRDGWDFKCSSSKDNDHDCKLAFDGDEGTYWQSADDALGHSVEIDLKRKVNLHSLAVKPTLEFRTVGGSVRKHRVEAASEEGKWELVALGTWRDSDGGEHVLPSTFAVTEVKNADDYRSEICDVRTTFGPICAPYDT